MLVHMSLISPFWKLLYAFWIKNLVTHSRTLLSLFICIFFSADCLGVFLWWTLVFGVEFCGWKSFGMSSPSSSRSRKKFNFKRPQNPFREPSGQHRSRSSSLSKSKKRSIEVMEDEGIRPSTSSGNRRGRSQKGKIFYPKILKLMRTLFQSKLLSKEKVKFFH